MNRACCTGYVCMNVRTLEMHRCTCNVRGLGVQHGVAAFKESWGRAEGAGAGGAEGAALPRDWHRALAGTPG